MYFSHANFHNFEAHGVRVTARNVGGGASISTNRGRSEGPVHNMCGHPRSAEVIMVCFCLHAEASWRIYKDDGRVGIGSLELASVRVKFSNDLRIQVGGQGQQFGVKSKGSPRGGRGDGGMAVNAPKLLIVAHATCMKHVTFNSA